jgi:hypothetical protein
MCSSSKLRYGSFWCLVDGQEVWQKRLKNTWGIYKDWYNGQGNGCEGNDYRKSNKAKARLCGG